MKNAPFPETLALVIYVGTVLTREAPTAQTGRRVEGGALPGREPGAPVFAAPALRAPFSTPTSRTLYSGFPGSRGLYRAKVNTIIPGPLTRRFWSCK